MLTVRSMVILAICLAGFVLHEKLTPCLGAEIDFGRDIRPILSDKCFQCHGADEGTRQAELRLDVRDDAVAARGETAAIVPGHVDQGLLIERILSTDPDVQMPPPDSNKSLTAQQIKLLQEWIAQGARYSEHWALQPVQPVEIPAEFQDPWCRNEIDAFILAKLRQSGIAPSPEASRTTLIRRVYQDLIGLLPTPEETQAFVKDNSADAYEKLVDRLLQNPHYGERWGRHWLDQARYADSHGFTIDGARTMWPYRDWVINALNCDLPFDEFTREQLAGDLMFEPTKSQLVATGFHRNTMINQEGGVKPDQYRHEATVDRVNTTGSVWLGLTIGCAQCHTHKFDPITHDDYYRLYAFFNRCRDSNDTGATADVFQEEMFGLADGQLQEIHRLEGMRKKLQKLESARKDEQNEQMQRAKWDWLPAQIQDFSTDANGSFQRLPDGSLLSDRNGDDNDTYRVSLKLPRGSIVALRLRVLPHPSLPHQGPGLAHNGNFVLTNFEANFKGKRVPIESAWADHEQQDYPAQAVIDGDHQSGWAINVTKDQKEKTPGLVMNAPHELTLMFAKPLQIDSDDAELSILLHHGANMRYLIGRFALDFSIKAPSVPRQKPDAEIAQLKKQIQLLESQLPGRGLAENQMVMSDLESPPETFRLKRGDFLQPAREEGPLSPGIPAVLQIGDSAERSFQNRLDLADWLVSRDNPLTARVTVNRIWMRYFGLGIVETENDFGFQGSPPSHPELLDWLAMEFMDCGWSMKTIHRLIVTSATYRQSSDHREDLEEVDPRNLLLARQSRLRVEAEIVRDMALSASGKLTGKIGGPSVYPPQPDGVYSFTQSKKNWPENRDSGRYRRTMYTMFYRSAPYPLMTTFDSPDFSTVCTQRPRSNTPLQSLALANDVMFMELAQGLASRIEERNSENDQFADRLIDLFELCLSRAPSAEERSFMESYWNAEFSRYERDPEAAKQLIQSEEIAPEKLADRAAWTSVARVIMNTDEFVTRN